MGPALGDSLPLMIGVALSPVPIIAAILMLLSPRARSTAPAFLLGWFLGIAIALTAFSLLASILPESGEPGPQPIIGTIKILLAAGLLFLAIRRWRGRPAPGKDAPLPGWMSSIDGLHAPAALGLGLALSALNPKNLVLAASAGLIVGAAGMATGSLVVTLLILALLASLTIAVPVLLYLVLGARLAGTLDTLRVWLVHNNATVMATLLLVFAFVVLGKGIASF